MLLRSFRETMRRIAAPGTRVLAAVSGGADSVALAHLLARVSGPLGLRVGIAHVHHGLRGSAADADERFVERLAERLGVPFRVGRLTVPTGPGQGSVEELARRARYRWLTELARSEGWQTVVLGHHRDDQAETVLLALLRGSGRPGLGGIHPERDGLFARPLLEVPRRTLTAYLAGRGLEWVEDGSNRDPRHPRNRLRHRVLPVLEREFGEQVSAALARSATLLRDEEAAVAAVVERRYTSVVEQGDREASVSVPILLREIEPVRRRLLRQMVADVSRALHPIGHRQIVAIERLLRSTRGSRRLALADDVTVERRYDRLTVSRGGPSEIAFDLPLPVPGRVEIPATGETVVARVLDLSEAPPSSGLPVADRTWLALDALPRGGSWKVRSRRPGDRFHPLGGPGRRKLSDFLIDSKVPSSERGRLPLVLYRGEIAWVAGHRPAERYRVRPDTRRVLALERVR